MNEIIETPKRKLASAEEGLANLRRLGEKAKAEEKSTLLPPPESDLAGSVVLGKAFQTPANKDQEPPLTPTPSSEPKSKEPVLGAAFTKKQ